MAYIFGSIWDRFNRNALNNLSKNLEIQGKSIQDLVAKGQLTPEQYADLITAINGNIRSGNVSIYDIDKNKGKLDETYLSEELLEQIAGTAPISPTIADRSITAQKLAEKSVTTVEADFIEGGNLYDSAVFLPGILSNTSLRYNELETSPESEVIFIPISADRTYTIKPLEIGQVTYVKYAIFDNLPKGQTMPLEALDQSSPNTNEFTFTNTVGGDFLAMHLSNDGNRIPAIVQIGDEITETYFNFDKVGIRDNSLEAIKLKDGEITVNKTDFITFANDNLYNPENKIEGILMTGGRYRTGESFPGQHIVYVNIDPNETYSILPVEDDSSWNFTRYSVFKELPTMEDEVAHYLVNGDDNNRSTVTFTNDAEGKYLLIYLTNNTNQNVVKCQVNRGASISEYEAYGIKIDGLDLSGLESDKDKVKLYGNFNEMFNYSEEEVILDDLTVDLKDSTSSNIHSLYDNLISLYPNSVSKRRIGYGTDSSGGQNTGLPIYEYTIKPPNNINMNTTRPEKLTYSGDTEYVSVLIGAGVHGNEKMPVYAVYKLIKNILENKNDTISSIRDNCLIKVVPVINVSGYDLGTYENANGININKNFEDGTTREGGTPYSQYETRAMKTFFETNPNADIFLDCHSFRGREGANQISYHYSFNPDVIKSYATFMRRMSNNWKDRVITTYVENEALGYSESTFSSNATAYREAHNKYGIKYSSLIEFGDGIPDHRAYSEGLLKIGVELYANFLSSLLGRYFS